MNWMEISLPLLQSALQTLYGDPDPQVFTFSINKYLIWIIKNKYAAQKWLVKAQRDPSAWNWSFELLKDGNPTEGTVWNFDKVAINLNSSRDFQTEKVQYFGAIAIHYKITNCWVELPPDKVEDILSKTWWDFNCEFRLMICAKKYSNLYFVFPMARKWFWHVRVRPWQHWSSIEWLIPGLMLSKILFKTFKILTFQMFQWRISVWLY